MAKKKKNISAPKDEFEDADVEEHRHCYICSTPIPMDQEVCSPACKLEYENMRKKNKTTALFMYGAIIVMVLFLLLSML